MHSLGQLFRNQTHDAIVARVATALRNQGFKDVMADVPGFATPTKIVWKSTGNGHVPDLTAGQLVIEVETDDTLSIEHTRLQCELFSHYARQHHMTFVVVVPRGFASVMRIQLIRWGYTAEVWEA